MTNKNKFDNLWMNIAHEFAMQSHDKRAKVGAVIVKDDRVVSNGWNGTPPGDDNTCQDEDGVTKPDVIHAEMNALLKAARSGVATQGSTMYCTFSPCVPCSRAMRVAGITRLVYTHLYRNGEGADYLEKHGIDVTRHEIK